MAQDGNEQAPAFTRLETLTAVVVVGVLALALGLVALAKPTNKSESTSIGYTQSGAFGYSATASKDSPYGPGGLTTGAPILLNEVGPVTATFQYKLASRAAAHVHGSASIQAVVKLSQGLTRAFPVVANTTFSGSRVALSGRLPLDAIQRYVSTSQAAFGDSSYGTATVTLQPKVALAGALGSHSLKTSYAPQLPFSLSGNSLVIGQSSGMPGADQAASDPLKPSKQGKVSYKTSVPNTVPLLVVHPTVTLSREIGFGLAGLCLVLGLLLARPLLRAGEANEPARIRTLYGAHLIEVRDLTLRNGPVAEVASMDSLADLAKKYESMIMHVRRDDGDDYLVWDNGMLYRYRPTLPAAPEPAAVKQEGVVLTKPSPKKLNGVAKR